MGWAFLLFDFWCVFSSVVWVDAKAGPRNRRPSRLSTTIVSVCACTCHIHCSIFCPCCAPLGNRVEGGCTVLSEKFQPTKPILVIASGHVKTKNGWKRLFRKAPSRMTPCECCCLCSLVLPLTIQRRESPRNEFWSRRRLRGPVLERQNASSGKASGAW